MLHTQNKVPMVNSKDFNKEESLYRKWDINISMRKKKKSTRMVSSKPWECSNCKKTHLLKFFITPIPILNHHFNMPILINMMKTIKSNNLATIKTLSEGLKKLLESLMPIKSFKSSKRKASQQVLCNNWEKIIKEK